MSRFTRQAVVVLLCTAALCSASRMMTAQDEKEILDKARNALTQEDLYEGAKAWSMLVRNDPDAAVKFEGAYNYTLAVKAYELMVAANFVDDANVVYPPTFSCATFSSTSAPTSVHRVRVSDVKVVAALGDSLTAAFGAGSSTIIDIREYRGISWSIGGDGSVPSSVTLPNILRKYNPNVIGFSSGIGSSNTRFNVAVSGAVSQDTPGQATELVNKLRDSRNGVDFNNDWKVITYFIGANNLCRYCRDTNRDSAANFASNVRKALDTLAQIPRTIVNLVGVVDVTKLKVIEGPGYTGCDAVHQTVCSCGTSNDAAVRDSVSRVCTQYNNELKNIANDARYQRDDFTVVYQPMYENTQIPRDSAGNPIREYFAPDCFHFATVTHQGVAVTLWNNMLKPNGQKPAWVPGQGYVCPASTDYICTPRNQNSAQGRCNV
eukprot:TRINITY_DN490_c0_g2_i1.p1 TRINITY_DN490_c0_g2~~TRINITY_DN490_c0_g2_i1.p1  ORF type:complete len:434 (-),score=83.84 TRINITY_DN490_c0_g2_i1:97-1398(-)